MRTTIRKRGIIALLYVMLFCIIYQSGSVAAASKANTWDFYLTRILMIGLGMILAFLDLLSNWKRISYRYLYIILGVPVFGVVVNSFLYSKGVPELAYKIYLFVVSICMFDLARCKKANILVIYYRIILLIASITLVFYIAIELLHFPIPYVKYTAPNGFCYREYFSLYFSYSNQTFPRLSGLFWEPGMYVIHLNLAMWCYLVSNKKKMKFGLQTGIILLNIACAQSATGYIVCAIIIATGLLSYRSTTIDLKTLLRIIAPIAALFLVTVVFVTKRRDTNIAGDSYYLRIRDFVNGLKLFISKPFFGAGYGNTELYNTYDQTLRGNSNGLITWLYTTGLVGVTFVFFPFIRNIMSYSRTKTSKRYLVCFLVMVVLFNISEPIYNLPLMAAILAGQYWLWGRNNHEDFSHYSLL